jgi:hypothetical protein
MTLDEPLVGFRAWAVNRWATPPRLLGTTLDMAWEPSGINEATCHFEVAPARALTTWRRWLLGRPAEPVERHQAPASNCGCGLYAYGSLNLAVAYATSAQWEYPWRPGPNNVLVLGAVLLWGAGGRRVQAGDLADGAGPGLRFRAPFARVLALLGPKSADDPAYEVGAALGLPVLPALGLELYAREHGVLLRAEEVAG